VFYNECESTLVKVKLIGFDSMGTRGMATVIDIDGFKIFIDPGVSYAPRRYGLPPHPVELEAFERHLDEIHREVLDSHVLVISHYHRDHYLYREGEEEYYDGKIVILKDPMNNINPSQKVRAYVLLNKMNVRERAREVLIADNQEYRFENILLKFSKPVPHGPRGTRLGYVVMTLVVHDDYRILHASDVQGPIEEDTAELILNYDPDLLIVSGPPTYFDGYKMKHEDIARGVDNLGVIAEGLRPGSTIIVDHHLLRDLEYRDKIKGVYEKARLNDVKVLTAAEYMGREIRQLEAMRKILWSGENQ
jgi:predicted metallo-beta-lactamase superfamily hydrolase